MTLERDPAAGLPQISGRPSTLFKLAWVFNAVAAVLVWTSLDGAGVVLGHLTAGSGAFPIFLTGATSGALADASAGLMRHGPRKPQLGTMISETELLVGLSIVFLVVSIVCLVLGIAAAAGGLFDLAAA